MKLKLYSVILLLVSGVLAACGGSAGPNPSDNLAVVYEVQLLQLESFPVQVQAIARGNLPDSCSQLGETVQEFDDEQNTFRVRIPVTRPADAMCAQMLSPFEVSVPLDVYGLPAGKYTVDINGVFAEFEFAQDNILPTP